MTVDLTKPRHRPLSFAHPHLSPQGPQRHPCSFPLASLDASQAKHCPVGPTSEHTLQPGWFMSSVRQRIMRCTWEALCDVRRWLSTPGRARHCGNEDSRKSGTTTGFDEIRDERVQIPVHVSYTCSREAESCHHALVRVHLPAKSAVRAETDL